MGSKADWNKDQLVENLIRSATNSENPDNLIGFGIPNFPNAYNGEILDIFLAEEKSEWTIYPNPLEGYNLFVRLGNHEEGEFTIYQLNGSVVQNNQVKRTSHREAFQIQLPGLPTGMYIVQMRSGNDLKRTKLIKR